MIAYGEWCKIHDIQRRFSFGIKDQAWSLKSFCEAEFFLKWKRTEKASDINIRRGTESSPLASLSKEAIYFSIGYYSKSKKCLKVVKFLPDHLPQFIDAGKDWRQEEKGTTEDEMVEWHYPLDGHEFEQAPGVGNGQGGLGCCSPCGHKE